MKKEKLNNILYVTQSRFLNLFCGRTNRLTYLAMSVIGAAISFLYEYFHNVYITTSNNLIPTILIGCIVLIFVVIAASVTTRRLHDLGLTGIFTFLLVIPLFNFLMPLLLIFIPGQRKANKYGATPKSGMHWKTLFLGN